MATFPGCLLDPGGTRYQDPGYVQSSNRGNWSPYGTLIDNNLPNLGCQSLTYSGITPLIPVLKDGCTIPHFADDYYDRIHIVPPIAALGQVLSDQTEQIEVWNAYRATRTLNSIVGQNTVGVTFDSDEPGGVPPPPVVYNQFQSRLYTFDINVIGPPGINAIYDFTFDSETVQYRITGQRLALFPMRADWSQPVVERFEWKTQIIDSYDDERQAIALRVYPRHFLKANIGGFRLNKQILNAAVAQNQALPFAVPAWQDQAALTQTSDVGEFTIYLDTQTRVFEVDGLAVLMTGPEQTEIVEIASIQPDSLTLKTGLESRWTIGSEVYPMRLMRLPKSLAVNNQTGDIEFTAPNWEQLEPEIIPPETAPGVEYMNYPVLELIPNWAGGRRRTFGRKMGIFDPDTGPKVWDAQGDEARVTDGFSWFLNGRDVIYWFKTWLYARRGKQSPVWLPSWGSDMTLTEALTPSSVNMQIRGTWGSRFFRSEPGVYHHFRLQTRAGNIFYRSILSVTEAPVPGDSLVSFANPDGTDSFGIDIAPADVELISFLRLCSINSDSIDLSWQTLRFATCNLSFYKGDQPG